MPLKSPNYDTIISNIKNKCPNLRDKNFTPRFDTFIQMWGSTCLGFDVDEEGNTLVGGQMMTEAYTTVAKLASDLYIVCFREEPCYAVKNPSDKFFEDLKNRHMASKREAEGRY